MFWDDLVRIDRCTNSVAILEKHRLRAYYEFRDRSEPIEAVGHSGPRRKRKAVASAGEAEGLPYTCKHCGKEIYDKSAYLRHIAVHAQVIRREAAVAAQPSRSADPRTPAPPHAFVPTWICRPSARTTARPDFLKWTCHDCGRFVFMWADSGSPSECRHCQGSNWVASPWTGRAA